MTLGVLLGFILILGAIGYWQSSMRAQERAVSICQALCKAHRLALLDETVTLRRTRLKRLSGAWGVYRLYTFEYTLHDDKRHVGEIALFKQTPYQEALFSHERAEIALDTAKQSSHALPAHIIRIRKRSAEND